MFYIFRSEICKNDLCSKVMEQEITAGEKQRRKGIHYASMVITTDEKYIF